jgi:geranylgeranyl pyrophosphate synthase
VTTILILIAVTVTAALIAIGCLWCALVLGARCDEAAERAREYAEALRRISSDKGNYPRDE